MPEENSRSVKCPIRNDRPCIGEECAWWNPRGGDTVRSCSVNWIARSMSEIPGALKKIKDAQFS